MDVYDFLPADFNDIGVWAGDEVCLGPIKFFIARHYADFILFSDGDVGPFRVVDTYPAINATEIMVGNRSILVRNDLLKEFCWN